MILFLLTLIIFLTIDCKTLVQDKFTLSRIEMESMLWAESDSTGTFGYSNQGNKPILKHPRHPRGQLYHLLY